jgi:hypothetical protein
MKKTIKNLETKAIKTATVKGGGDGRVFWHWSFPVSTTNP